MNANMAALDEPADEAEDSAVDGGDNDVERQDGAATARKAHAQELLSDDQINQVGRGAPQQTGSVPLVSASPNTKCPLHAKGRPGVGLDVWQFTRAVIVKGMQCFHAVYI